MPPKLISGFIRSQIAKYLGPQVLAGTLVKITPGVRSGTVSAGTHPTSASFGCRYFMRSYDDEEMKNTSIRTSDRRISILGGTIASAVVPAPNDQFVDVKGLVWNIEDPVKADSDEAVYVCHARR